MEKINVGKCKVVSSCIALSILGTTLTGCGTAYVTQEPEKETDFTSIITEQKVLDRINQINYGSDRVIDIEDQIITIPQKEVAINPDTNTIYKFSEEDYANLVNAISSKSVVYVYEDLYGIDNALQKTGAHLNHNRHNHIFDYHKDLTQSQLIKQIKINNDKYLREFPQLYSLDDETIEQFANCVIEELNLRKNILTDDSKERIYCALGDLKVVGIDSENLAVNPSGVIINAFLGSDGAVLVDEKQISKMPDEKATEKTFKHEILHIFQRTCQDEYKSNYRIIGSSEYWNDLKVNPLFWNWSYEGASERLVMDEYESTNAQVYQSYVSYINTLDYALLFDDDLSYNAVEESTLNIGTDNFYSLFDVKSLEDKKEIIKMMYSIDYIQTNREDFRQAYKEAGKDIYEDYYKITYDMKSSVCQTITKEFYLNLAESVKKGNVPLEDIFYCIKIFEQDMKVHLNYLDNPNETTMEANQMFLNNYIDIQNNFFTFLSTGYNLRYEEIIEIFNNYSSLGEINYERLDLSWLNEKEKAFIGGLATKYSTVPNISIRNINYEKFNFGR